MAGKSMLSYFAAYTEHDKIVTLRYSRRAPVRFYIPSKDVAPRRIDAV